MRRRHGGDWRTPDAPHSSLRDACWSRPAWHSKYAACALACRAPAGFSACRQTGAPRRSIVPCWPLALMRAPEIAVGMGETRRTPITLKKFAALDFAAPMTNAPNAGCGGENTRIQNYAARAIEGIATNPNDDLNLFLADGTAGANLSLLLENMAKVEIGPWAAQARLIAAAIDRLIPRSVAAGMPQPGDAHGVVTRPRE